MSVMLSCTSNINWFINTFNSSLKEITDQLKNSILSEKFNKQLPLLFTLFDWRENTN